MEEEEEESNRLNNAVASLWLCHTYKTHLPTLPLSALAELAGQLLAIALVLLSLSAAIVEDESEGGL